MTESYDAAKAEDYWSRRLAQSDELAAVLSFSLPEYLNRAYSQWETQLVAEALSGLQHKSVLDLGSGVGRMTVPLAQQGARVVALDNSAAMLEACRQNVTSAGVAGGVSFEKGSAAELPFPDNSFDAVACLGLLEHLPPTVREATVAEIQRVVRRPGRVVLVVNNPNSTFLQQEPRYDMQHQSENGYFVGLVGRQSIEDAFMAKGFRIEARGSNMFQSLVKHVGHRLGLLDDASTAMSSLADLSVRLDLQYRSKGDLDWSFADQWVILAESK